MSHDVETSSHLKWYPWGRASKMVLAQSLKGRLGQNDVAALVFLVASDDARLKTGHRHFVDAGWR